MTGNGILETFERNLRERERSEATIEKYLHDAGMFLTWLAGRDPTQELAVAWKKELLSGDLAPSTVNCRLAAVNALFGALGIDLHVSAVKQQRRMFRSEKEDLSLREYRRLVMAAQNAGKERLALILETICATGIRVSETRHITVEAAAEGCARVFLKGKVRIILIPASLCRKLLRYAKEKKISAGEIFLTRTGRSLSRKQIWAEMKAVCAAAGVNPSKVFPHNLRHLFARTFYQSTGDVVKLADVLGHSSLSTTRIYLISTGEEHRRELEELKLVC